MGNVMYFFAPKPTVYRVGWLFQNNRNFIGPKISLIGNLDHHSSGRPGLLFLGMAAFLVLLHIQQIAKCPWTMRALEFLLSIYLGFLL
jgi:hypothetical protein